MRRRIEEQQQKYDAAKRTNPALFATDLISPCGQWAGIREDTAPQVPLNSFATSSSVMRIPSPPPPPEGHPSFFEWKPEFGSYWCKLCWKYVDDGHILSQAHQKKVMYQTAGIIDYLKDSVLPCISDVAPTCNSSSVSQVAISTRPPMPDGDPQYYEWRPDMMQWWCRLCNRYAAEGHVTGQLHQKRAGYQEMGVLNYLAMSPCSPPPPLVAHAHQSNSTTSTTSCSVEWERYFSKEHGRHYFVNLLDRTVQWSIGPSEPYLALF